MFACIYTSACVHAHVYFSVCNHFVASSHDEGTCFILSYEIAHLMGRRSPATSAAHLTCRHRPQECSLINLNYSFPGSAAPRSVVNPGFWFKSSGCRLFRRRGPLNTSCLILTNLNTDAASIHHRVLACAPTYQCLANRLIMNSAEL